MNVRTVMLFINPASQCERKYPGSCGNFSPRSE